MHGCHLIQLVTLFLFKLCSNYFDVVLLIDNNKAYYSLLILQKKSVSTNIVHCTRLAQCIQPSANHRVLSYCCCCCWCAFTKKQTIRVISKSVVCVVVVVFLWFHMCSTQFCLRDPVCVPTTSLCTQIHTLLCFRFFVFFCF